MELPFPVDFPEMLFPLLFFKLIFIESMPDRSSTAETDIIGFSTRIVPFGSVTVISLDEA